MSLISNANITPVEFFAFLQQCGAVLNPDRVYDGRIDNGNLHVPIALDNSELKNFDADEIEQMSQHLGDRPKTHILLDISKTPGSQQLATDFARKFAAKWSCVVYDSDERIYSPHSFSP